MKKEESDKTSLLNNIKNILKTSHNWNDEGVRDLLLREVDEERLCKELSGINFESYERLSTIHLAALLKDVNIMKILIEESRSKINVLRHRLERFFQKYDDCDEYDEIENLARKYAGKESTLFKTLIEKYGREPKSRQYGIHQVDHNKVQAIHIVASYGHVEVAKVLIENGHAVADGKRTPLHFATVWTVTIMKMVLQNGANVNAVDEDGETPLHHAAVVGKVNTMDILLENGADVNAATAHANTTPLHLACRNGHADVAEWLLRNGATMTNMTARYSWTALDYAAMNRFVDVVKVLIQHGADVNASKKGKRSPLMVAITCEGVYDENKESRIDVAEY